MNKKNEEIKVCKPDFTKLPLTGYYKSLPNATRVIVSKPKDDFLNSIARLTGRTPETVRSWCLGKKTPPPHIRVKIAKYIGTPIETLFPKAI